MSDRNAGLVKKKKKQCSEIGLPCQLDFVVEFVGAAGTLACVRILFRFGQKVKPKLVSD